MILLKDNPSLKACIFDLDGTILDSMLLWQEVDRKYLSSYGIEFDPSFSNEIKTMTFNESAKYFIKKYNIPKTENEIKNDWNQMVEIEYRDNIKSKKGVKKLLNFLFENNIKMCVATSCNKEHAIMALKRLNLLHYFSFIKTCNEVGKNKEHPDIYINCAKDMKVEYQDCFVFEDLFSALEVAHKEGFKTVGIYDHLSISEKEKMINLTDYYIHDFNELFK